MSFESFPEQEEAKRLLAAALAEGPAHAYLFHGPPGARKRRAPIPFRRLSEAAVRADLLDRAPGLAEDELVAIARLAAGRLDRGARLLDPDGRKRRDALLDVARSVYAADRFDPGDAARTLVDGIK